MDRIRTINCLDSSVNNRTCCRFLIFWGFVTTLASVVSVYYAVDVHSAYKDVRQVGGRIAQFVALLLRTQQPRVRFLAFLKIYFC